MLTTKLAYRNIAGAGIRTWLNVFVLSFSFVSIIWMQGMIDGMKIQSMTELINTEYGGGHYRHKTYDPFEPLLIEESHGKITESILKLIEKKQAAPVLITPGSLFKDGRVQSALIKGIDPAQDIVNMPTNVLLNDEEGVVPALIGARMAKQLGLKTGDFITGRWRDIKGTFDAIDIKIIHIMKTNVPSVDNGQVWISIYKMYEMLGTSEEATYIILKEGIKSLPPEEGVWKYRDLNFLLKDLMDIIKAKSVSSGVMYVLLLGMALLAIFDTQVLAVFRRRKEMGTLMALGMTRQNVISLFTLEGALHGILALLLGALYGIPLLYITTLFGYPMPEVADKSGIALPHVLYPSYGLTLVLGTTIILFVTVTIVSFLPTRKISRLKPTDALRGKMS